MVDHVRLDPEVTDLLLSRPDILRKMFWDLGIQSFCDIRHMWSSGHAMVSELEEREGKLPADEAFSVAAFWTLALSRAVTKEQQQVQNIVADRSSSLPNHAVSSLPNAPSKIKTYRTLISHGSGPHPPTFAAAAAVDAFAKEKATKEAKLDAFFQMLMEDVLDMSDLGLTQAHLQDAGAIQSAKESIMAVPSQLSIERLGALMAAFGRWRKFAVPRKYPLRSPTPLMLAEFLAFVSKGGPTAAAGVWQALRWFKDKMGLALPLDHFLVLPYKFLPASHQAKQQPELEPWEFVNLWCATHPSNREQRKFWRACSCNRL